MIDRFLNKTARLLNILLIEPIESKQRIKFKQVALFIKAIKIQTQSRSLRGAIPKQPIAAQMKGKHGKYSHIIRKTGRKVKES